MPNFIVEYLIGGMNGKYFYAEEFNNVDYRCLITDGGVLKVIKKNESSSEGASVFREIDTLVLSPSRLWKVWWGDKGEYAKNYK